MKKSTYYIYIYIQNEFFDHVTVYKSKTNIPIEEKLKKKNRLLSSTNKRKMVTYKVLKIWDHCCTFPPLPPHLSKGEFTQRQKEILLSLMLLLVVLKVYILQCILLYTSILYKVRALDIFNRYTILYEFFHFTMYNLFCLKYRVLYTIESSIIQYIPGFFVSFQVHF